MAKKQITAATANIATAAAAALQQEKALLTTKRGPVARKHSKATVSVVAAPQPAEPVQIAEPSTLNYAEIAELAYLKWEARGCTGGWEEQQLDWLHAEAELRS